MTTKLRDHECGFSCVDCSFSFVVSIQKREPCNVAYRLTYLSSIPFVSCTDISVYPLENYPKKKKVYPLENEDIYCRSILFMEKDVEAKPTIKPFLNYRLAHGESIFL